MILLFVLLALGLVRANEYTPVVEIESGPIQGKIVQFNGTDVYHFLGIPYAEPPLGKLRFQRPVKPQKWSNLRVTTEYGKSCNQRNQHIPTSETSEDCLFLNVFVNKQTFDGHGITKVNSTGRPVMVWLHGGAMVMGSGDEFYEGIPLVPLHDIILVTLNYRLNAFGFMYFGETEPSIQGNMGLWDQNLALQWIQENIHLFGGNPNSVTLFGESAGAMSTSAHILSPASKGLFHRAILESGTIQFAQTREIINNHVIENSHRVLNRTACRDSPDILGCLQSLDTQTLIDLQADGILRFTWIYGDEMLPNSPEQAFSDDLYNHVDLLVGTEKDEFGIFLSFVDPKSFDPINPQDFNYTYAVGLLSILCVPESLDLFRELYFGPVPTDDSNFLRKQLVQAYSDFVLSCTTYNFAVDFMRASPNSGRVYAYYHTQKPSHSAFPVCDESPWMGVCHTSEIPHVFGHPLRLPEYYSDDDVKLSLQMMKLWTHFAETGEMLTVGGRKWNSLQEDADQGSDPSAMVMNANNLGTVNTERIKYCVDQWPKFVKYSSNQLLNILSAA